MLERVDVEEIAEAVVRRLGNPAGLGQGNGLRQDTKVASDSLEIKERRVRRVS